ncbi:acyl-CoA synthetase (AMP-forming)/AMP-acid ligase II [Catenuloplanes nepalensis]|uniref:Acyl-CoA synthetase (AMP-forming)/AMP-acid ligase II n=1 Tax=Catenuloplanes nepalensis TaxID=587533 RepID=A0ABT9MM42_9ACTN|nr:AMP-binding protein [Catenuloplanes nepalensis]MDP9792488.1 acyl-CoA synthetase (AMP-forming)/AMP-acid ligase II [Catenuloplanes nepalensis]
MGADAFPARTLAAWRALDPHTPVLNEYGPTEASVGNCVYRIEGTPPAEMVPIGRPIPNTSMYVLDQAGDPVSVGVAGELYIGGACVVRGYAGREQLTRQRFLPNPFAGATHAVMYRTGDLGRWLPSGQLDFLGRIDDQVKIRGYRVEPAEIEAALVRHPSISAAVVTADGPDRTRLTLTGYYVAARALNPSDVREHLSALVPDYLIPAQLMQIDAVPLNANGKVDRPALPTPARPATPAQPNASPNATAAAANAPRPSADPDAMAVVLAWHRVYGTIPHAGTRVREPSAPAGRLLRLAGVLHQDTALGLDALLAAVAGSDTFVHLCAAVAAARAGSG